MSEIDESIRICAHEDCETPLPEDAHRWRKFCDEHLTPARPAPGSRRPPRRDTPPRVVFEVKNPGPSSKAKKETATKERVAGGALKMFTVASLGVQISGDAECAQTIKNGGPSLAVALGELAVYQPALEKIFAPGDATGQAGAWLGVALASMGIVLPVLAHHNLLPPSVAAKLAGVFVAANAPAA